MTLFDKSAQCDCGDAWHCACVCATVLFFSSSMLLAADHGITSNLMTFSMEHHGFSNLKRKMKNHLLSMMGQHDSSKMER